MLLIAGKGLQAHCNHLLFNVTLKVSSGRCVPTKCFLH